MVFKVVNKVAPLMLLDLDLDCLLANLSHLFFRISFETIDETIYELLDRKRKVVNSVTDGIEEESGGSVMDGLIRDLVRRGQER